MALVEDSRQPVEASIDYSAMPAASVGRRFVAVLINNLLMFASVLLPILLFKFFNVDFVNMLGSAIVSSLFILLFIQIYFMYRYSQTIGKRLMKIKVMRYPHTPIRFSHYLFREFFDILISYIFSILYLLPNMIMIWRNRKDFHRGLTDAIIKTQVVKLPNNGDK